MHSGHAANHWLSWWQRQNLALDVARLHLFVEGVDNDWNNYNKVFVKKEANSNVFSPNLLV